MQKSSLTVLSARGYFWWHGQTIPERRLGPEGGFIPGTLSIDDNGRIELDLDGVLSEDGPFPSHNHHVKPIQGILKKTKEDIHAQQGLQHVLLLGVWKNGGSFKSNGITFERFFAEQCIRSDIGLGEQPDIVFSSLSVDLKGYEDWLGASMITVSHSGNGMSATCAGSEIDTYPIEAGELRVEKWCRVRGPRYDLNWTQEARAIYAPKVPMVLDDVIVQYQALQDLLILLIDGYYGLEWPDATTTNGALCRCYFFKRRDLDQKKPTLFAPALFSVIRKNFGDIWSSWMRVRNELGPGAYLYLGTRNGVTLYPENWFMNLMWGIEALHRKELEPIGRKSAVKEKIDRIVGQVSGSKDKRWLKRQLHYATEPSLEERIFGAFRGLPLQIEDARLRNFAKNCAQLRNDISHFGGLRSKGVYEDFVRDVMQKTEAVSLLYHAYLLQRIGVDPAILTHWVQTGPGSYHKTYTLFANGLAAAPPTA